MARLGFKSTAIPSFTDSNVSRNQALTLALKSAEYADAQRKQNQLNALGHQIGNQFKESSTKDINLSDILGTVLNSNVPLNDSLNLLNIFKGFTNSPSTSFTDGEKRVNKLSDMFRKEKIATEKEAAKQRRNLPKHALDLATTQTTNSEDQQTLAKMLVQASGNPQAEQSVLQTFNQSGFDDFFNYGVTKKFQTKASANLANILAANAKPKVNQQNRKITDLSNALLASKF